MVSWAALRTELPGSILMPRDGGLRLAAVRRFRVVSGHDNQHHTGNQPGYEEYAIRHRSVLLAPKIDHQAWSLDAEPNQRPKRQG